MNFEMFYKLIDIVLIMLMITAPIAALIALLEIWESYKRRKDQHKKEAERIIVKMAEDVKTQTESIKTLEQEEEKLKLAIFDLEQRKRNLIVDSASKDDPNDLETITDVEELEEITIDYDDFTINELQDIARQLKIKGFSRMKKAKLIEILENYSVEEIMQLHEDDKEN